MSCTSGFGDCSCYGVINPNVPPPHPNFNPTSPGFYCYGQFIGGGGFSAWQWVDVFATHLGYTLDGQADAPGYSELGLVFDRIFVAHDPRWGTGFDGLPIPAAGWNTGYDADGNPIDWTPDPGFRP